MKQNFQTLLEEIQDILPEKKLGNALDSGLKDFQSFQQSLAPEKEFTDNLKSRLEGVYFLKQQKKSGFWMNMKTWMNITGVVFLLPIFVYIGYSMYFQSTETPIITPISEQTPVFEAQDLSLEDIIPEPNDISNLDEESSEDREVQSTFEPVEDKKQENILKEDIEILPEVVQNSESQNFENQNGETQEIAETQILKQADQIVGQASEQEEDSEDTPDFLPPENKVIGNKPQVPEAQNLGVQSPESQGFSEPAAASMMMTEMTQASKDSGGGIPEEKSEFQIFCEEEQGGTFFTEENTCELPDGTMCTENESCGMEDEKTEAEKISELENEFGDILEGFFGE